MMLPRLSRAVLALDSCSETQAHNLAAAPVDRAETDRMVFQRQKKDCALRMNPGVRSGLRGDVIERTASRRSEYRLTVDANPAHVPQVISWLIRRSAWTLPDTQRLRMRGALHELLINAIEHGNLEISYRDKQRALAEGGYALLLTQRFARTERKSRQVTIHVLCDISAKRLTYCIIDEGKGFSWRAVFSRFQSGGYSEDANGRGIFLVRSFFPSLSYNEQGNEVTITVPIS